VQAVLVPSEDYRRVIEETLPVLPEEIGGGPSTVVTQGIQWAAVGFDAPMKMSLQLVIQSADPAAAQALADQIDKVFNILTAPPAASQPTRLERSVKEIREVLPELPAMLVMLQPKVVEDRLVLSLNNQQTNQLVDQLLTPMIVRSRQLAKQAISMAQCRHIAMALYLYTEEHQGQWPDDLQTLVQADMIGESSLVNPANPRVKPGYIYVKPPVRPEKIRNPSQHILIYENFTDWPAEGICASFVDSHAERIIDQRWFEKLLADSKATPANQP
jgi:hypothetical protein